MTPLQRQHVTQVHSWRPEPLGEGKVLLALLTLCLRSLQEESEEWNQVQMVHVSFIPLSYVPSGHKLKIYRQRSQTHSRVKKY